MGDDDAATMGKGVLIKANVEPWGLCWYWIPIGNCQACQWLQAGGLLPTCSNPAVPMDDFKQYLWHNDCPEFVAGISDSRASESGYEADMRDAMMAAGIAQGQPLQHITILQVVPWTPERAERASEQQALFRAWARARDAGYVDPSEGRDPGPI